MQVASVLFAVYLINQTGRSRRSSSESLDLDIDPMSHHPQPYFWLVPAWQDENVIAYQYRQKYWRLSWNFKYWLNSYKILSVDVKPVYLLNAFILIYLHQKMLWTCMRSHIFPPWSTSAFLYPWLLKLRSLLIFSFMFVKDC